MRLPRKDGTEVLADINADESLVSIPVVILTGTEAEAELAERLQHTAPAGSAARPMELQRFNNAVNQLGMFSRQPINIPSAQSQAESAAEAAGGGKKRWWWPFG